MDSHYIKYSNILSKGDREKAISTFIDILKFETVSNVGIENGKVFFLVLVQ